MSSKDGYYGGGTSASRPTEVAENATEHEVDTTAQHMADTSGFNIAAVSHEAEAAEAQRQSSRTTPGAYHVRPLAAVVAEEAAAVATARILESETIPPTELRRSSNALADSDANSEEGPNNTATGGDGGEIDDRNSNNNDATAIVVADVEAVAVPIDEAVPTFHAIPVVDALTTSRISEDGDEQRSYQLESGTNNTGTSPLTCARLDEPSTQQESTSAGGSSTNTKKSESDVCSMKNKYMIWSLAALLLVAVAMGLGLGLPRSQNSGESIADTTGNVEVTSYRLVEMEISPQLESFSQHVSTSVSLGLLLPTAFPGILSQRLIIGYGNNNSGTIKAYKSETKTSKTIESPGSLGPFLESASISLSDFSEESLSDSSNDSAIILASGGDGESFAVSYRDRVRMYTSLLHEAKRLAVIKKEGFNPETFLTEDTLSVANAATVKGAAAENYSPPLPSADLWNHKGQTLAGDDDPAIRGFGSSIGFSQTGPNFMNRLVVGSDSGHVRAYRFQSINGTDPRWLRLDGGLLAPDADINMGKAVVAMAGGGFRFAVGYPSLRKVSLYRFIDEKSVDENSSRPNIELICEIYSEGGDDDDLFGQSLSVDVFANFLVVGAKGYARAYWLTTYLDGYRYVAAGDEISGEESDGKEFGSVVASGRVPLHAGACVSCPFTLNKQRIAISNPAHDNGRGRVLLYQYNEDEGSWQLLASPLEGEKAGEGMGHDIRISPDMGTVVTSSSFEEVRTFRIQELQR